MTLLEKIVLYVKKVKGELHMKKVLVMCALFLFVLLSNSTCDDTLLRAGFGSSDFGLAFVGIAIALLVRGGDKK